MTKLLLFLSALTNNTVVKSSMLVLIGSMIANALAYLYHVIVGRILGPQQYGELAALLSLYAILNVPSQVVQTVLTKFFSILKATGRSGEVKQLLLLSLRVIVIISLFGLFGLLVGVDWIASFLHIERRDTFYWLYVIITLYFVGMVPQSLLAAYQLFFVQTVLVVVGMGFRLVLAILAAPYGVTATLASNSVANVTTLAITVFPLRFLFGIKKSRLTFPARRAVGFGIPTLLTTFAITAMYNQDVLLVKHFFNATDAGIYSSLSVLGKIIFYASSAITFVLFPIISERSELKRGHAKLVKAALLSVAGLSGCLTLLYFLFPSFVVHVLYGEAFYAAAEYVGLFGLFISFFALDNILLLICLAAEKIWGWVLGLIAAVIQLGAIWLFHYSLQTVIMINTIIAAALFVSLLIYYSGIVTWRHEMKHAL